MALLLRQQYAYEFSFGDSATFIYFSFPCRYLWRILATRRPSHYHWVLLDFIHKSLEYVKVNTILSAIQVHFMHINLTFLFCSTFFKGYKKGIIHPSSKMDGPPNFTILLCLYESVCVCVWCVCVCARARVYVCASVSTSLFFGLCTYRME